MKYQIVATDLDGTLLNKKGKISLQNWEAIREMSEKGVNFVPSSGRCLMELPAEIRDSSLIRYYILSGGAVVYDKTEDRLDMICPSKEVKDRVLDLVYGYQTCLFAHVGKVSLVDETNHNASSYESYNMNPYWVEYALEKEKPFQNLKEYLYKLENVPMLVIFFRNMEDLKACKKILEDEKEILVVQTDPYNLEIVSIHAGKGNALLSLAASLGIPREATIAVGDSLNDQTMLEAAGLSLAMENAIPEMKAIAHKVICDNDSHCAEYILKNYLF